MSEQDPKKLLRFGLIGTVIVALCCFTPILFVLLAAVGLAAIVGYLDYVLFPALAIFLGLSIYAYIRVRQAQAGAGRSESAAKQ